MKVVSVSGVSFRGKVIDSHTHLGKWGGVNYGVETLDVFMKNPLANGDTVERMIVASSECIESKDGLVDELGGNKHLLDIIAGNPKLAPLAVCQPNVTKGNTAKIEQLLAQNPDKFVGFKFHPRCMGLMADNRAYDSYMILAQKHSFPCLFHSDKIFDVHYPDGGFAGRCEFSNPRQIYELAKRHKNVPVILGHMGGNEGENTRVAVDVLVESIENSSAKMYADISWVNPDTAEKPDIIEAIRRLKNTKKGDMTERLMFGTDAPIGRFGNGGENGLSPQDAYAKVVQDVKNAIRNAFEKSEADTLIEKIFYKNAQELYFEKKQDIVPNVKKSMSAVKKMVIGLVVAGVAVGAGMLIKNNKDKN